MKTIWNALCVVAIANLLALAGFVGWLRSSDRLNLDRARQIRETLSRTITQEKADADQAKADAEAKQKQAEAAARAARPPITASERLYAMLDVTELDRQRAERMRQEVEDLRSQLAMERRALDRDIAAFQEEKKAFEQASKGQMDELAQAQFDKTMGVLVALKPTQGAELLRQILQPPGAQGATPGKPSADSPGFATVVGYLDAMDERPRSKIMAEFMKTDPTLAAELLEHLRRKGEFARVP